MCAALSPLQSDLCIEENSAFHRGQSRASMSCLCRPSRACIFLFLPIPASLSRLSKVEAKPLFSHLGLAAAPGFVHNRPTRLQRGWSGASLVSFPLPGAQNRTQGRTRAFFSFALSAPLFPYGEKLGRPRTRPALGRLDSSTSGSHWPNRAGLGLR